MGTMTGDGWKRGQGWTDGWMDEWMGAREGDGLVLTGAEGGWE